MERVELTAEQRKEYYRRALNVFEYVAYGPYLCNVLKRLLFTDYPHLKTINHVISSTSIAKKYFPEFWCVYTSYAEWYTVKTQAKRYKAFATDTTGNNIRRKVLTEAIEVLTHKKVYI